MFRDEVFQGSNLPYLLALLRVPGCGPRTLARLFDYTHSPELVFKLPAAELSSLGLRSDAVASIEKPAWARVERDLRWLEKKNNHLVTFSSRHYPPLLKQISDPPPVLYVRGEKQCLTGLQLGVVGSRRATADGLRLAREFSMGLTACGLTVTSGLALGIDSASHSGALQAEGRTIAVLGNGLQSVYPRRNAGLAESICEAGALVSEFPLEYKPLASNFPRRNRIISGMTIGILVVEAAIKSGSLITAHCAIEQGRDVFAIPGAIRNPMVRGCHLLIREGAKLVEQVEDITEEIGPLLHVGLVPAIKSTDAQQLTKGLDADAKLLLDNIGYLPVTVDELVETTGLPADATAVTLLNLELGDLIESMPGAKYIRKSLEN